MFSQIHSRILAALLLLSIPRLALAADDSPQTRYLSAAGQLNGFLGQVHRMFVACGERLGKEDEFLAQEKKWVEQNTQLVQSNARADSKVRAAMSQQQINRLEAADKALHQATLDSLRTLDAAGASTKCSNFLSQALDVDAMARRSKPLLDSLTAADRAMAESQKREQ